MGPSNSGYTTTVVPAKGLTPSPHISLGLDEHDALRAALAILLSPLDAIDPDSWRGQVGTAFCDLLGANCSAFLIDAPGMAKIYSEDYPQKTLDAYAGYYSAIDVSSQKRDALGLEVWNYATLHGPDMRDFRKSEIYRDFLVPNGICDAMGLTVRMRGTAREATIFCYRDKPDTPEFGDRGLALLGLLLPAFKAGVRDLIRYASQRQSLDAHLDSLTEGIRICDLEGKTIHQNPAFTAVLKAEPTSQRIQKGIEEVLQLLVAFNRERSGNADALAGRRISLEVHTHTASYEVRGNFLGRELHGALPRIAIAVQALPANTALSDRALQERYRLTVRELEITRRLAQGQSTKEVAFACGISLHTARRHTESIFTKLGVRNRSQIGPKLRAG
ncbi:MAG TPA: helix-turn-helix transcriptional regulator [Gemmatimonadaceae bacterium]|nr:helix-turn-helix transcriptional regulator [Gemmatimonadaceae bacterium]